ncbi:hypothetical protein Vretifemale_17832, partial [Volvox reticuliferus]
VHPAVLASRLPLDAVQPLFCTLQEDMLVTAPRVPVPGWAGAAAADAPRAGSKGTESRSSGSSGNGTAPPVATSPLLQPLLVWDLARGRKVAEVQVVTLDNGGGHDPPITSAMAAAAVAAVAVRGAYPNEARLLAALCTASLRQFINMAASADGTRLYLLDGALQLWILDLAAGQVLLAASKVL